ncbi:MAG: hypothetical protein PHE80_07115 [Candidatus Omnitrophica bacterium]|nr:hypothetical protein [Candidatus Omnitrophota bacterium]MDD5736979.1 hypothetical protein [Candidatus Omnitrophota bacterium]
MNKSIPNCKWEFLGTSVDSTSFMINGIDVWKHKWKKASEPKAEVKDPLYKQDFSFEVYEIEDGDKRIEFAAGEFSNCVWGFYIHQN